MTGSNPCNPQANRLFRDRYGNSPNLMTPNIHARRMIAAAREAEALAGEG